MNRFAVAVMGLDRPGIVAQVTAGLLRLGGNVEDVSTSILRGHFALMLIVTVPAAISKEGLDDALGVLRQHGLALAVWEVSGGLESTRPTHVLSAYGPDRTGIVHDVSTVLAEAGANVCDMSCRLHEGAPPVYVVTAEVALPAPGEAAELEAVVSRLKAKGLDVSLNAIEESTL